MKKTEILAICSHEGILGTILRLIRTNERWNATGAADVKEAVQLIDSRPFDLVLIGSGVDETDEQFLYRHSKTIPVIRHYGGGSGLLFGEIYQALEITSP